MVDFADVIACCGAKIMHSIHKEYGAVIPGPRQRELVWPNISTRFPNKGLVLAILNDVQIEAGAEQYLLDNGFKVLIDGWKNLNEEANGRESYCTLYARIDNPDKMRSRSHEKASAARKKLSKKLEVFFRHTEPKSKD